MGFRPPGELLSGDIPHSDAAYFLCQQKVGKNWLGFRPDELRPLATLFRPRTPDPVFTGALIFGATLYDRRLQFCTDLSFRHALPASLSASRVEQSDRRP